MTDPAHALRLATAERDSYADTCSRLHAEIAGLQVEIEDCRGRVVDADRRTRSRDAELAAEREMMRSEIVTLRARLAELEGRPVLTADALDEALIMAAAAFHDRSRDDSLAWPHKRYAQLAVKSLGPVTLPGPDRAEELCREIGSRTGLTILPKSMRAALSALAPTAPARPLGVTEIGNAVYAAVCPLLEAIEHKSRVITNGHHAAQEVVREVEAALAGQMAPTAPAPAPTQELAPTFTAADIDALIVEFMAGCHRSMEGLPVDDDDRAAMRAVLARARIHAVTAEGLAEAWIEATGFDAPEALKDRETVRVRMGKALTIAAGNAAKKAG